MNKGFINGIKGLQNDIGDDWHSLADTCQILGLKRQNLDVYRKQYLAKFGTATLHKTIKDEKNRSRKYFSNRFIKFVQDKLESKSKPFVIDKKKAKTADDSEEVIFEEGYHIQSDGKIIMVYSLKKYEQLAFELKDYKRIQKEYEEVKLKLDQATEKLFSALDDANAIQKQLNYIKAKDIEKD